MFCALSTLGLLAVLAGATFASDVIELNGSNFDNKVLSSDSVWLIEFYAPWCGHCKNLAPTWEQVGTALKGVVKVAKVDADSERDLGGRFGVRGFPTIKIFGANKNSPKDYNGGRTVSEFVSAAMKEAKKLVDDRVAGKSGKSGSGKKDSGKDKSGGSGGGDKDVVELTDSNFEELVYNSEDHWLVEFFAPWCGHCKNLAPEYASAASELKGKVKLGAVDATVHTVISGRFGVRGYPTLKYIPPKSKGLSDAEDYTGGRSSGEIINWCLDKYQETLPPPEINEIINNDVLKEACDRPLCIITFLPHLFDTGAVGRNNYIQIIRDVSDKYKNKGWGWVWTAATIYPKLEENFGVGGFGYPALAVFNSRKGKYAILKGSFGFDGITEHIRAVSVGRGSSEPLRGDLATLEATEPWDGKDYEYPEEDDIDLSDFDMDDDTESKDEL